MKNFCINLKGLTTKIINYEKKKKKKRNDTVSKRRQKHIVNKKFVTYAKKDSVLMMTIKNTLK